MSIIQCKINNAKIPREAWYKGEKGVYLSFDVAEKREPDQYGNTHAVSIYNSKTKEKTYIGDGKIKTFDSKPVTDDDLPPNDIEDAQVIPEGDPWKPPF